MIMACVKSQVFFVFLCLFGLCCLHELHIQDGAIFGSTTQTFYGRTVYSYKGIPYAEKPVRFQNPVPVKPWKGIRDATNDGSACVQRKYTNPAAPFEVIGTEDCLFINVYTPYDPKSCQSKKKLPVMVYIYQGAWVQGSNEQSMYGPEFLLAKNIVLVTFNYRLDAFGFLSTADKTAPGNWGLKDQLLALKWVNKNIQFFGGDPDQVTLFGASVGAASVHLHCLSPLSRGLFRGMISQSGTVYLPLAVHTAASVKEASMKTAEACGCPTSPSSALIECLRKVPAREILRRQAKLYGVDNGYHPPFVIKEMAPVYDAPFSDEPFFNCDPRNTSCPQCSYPWINGFERNDGSYYVCMIYVYPRYEALIEKRPYPYLATQLQLNSVFPDKVFPKIIDEILRFYFNGRPISRNDTQALADVFTDFVYYTTSMRATFNHPGTVYHYRNDYVASQSWNDLYGRAGSRAPKPTHLDDQLTLFEISSLFNRTYTESDLQVIKYHVNLWTNFAKTGDPTTRCDGVNWEPAGTEEDFKYLALGKTPVLKKGLPFPKRYAFWQSLFEKYARSD